MSEIPSNNFLLKLIEVKEEYMNLIEWDGLYSVAFISFVAICGSICLLSRVLVINYIYRYAPKDRPVNTMTLFEQVLVLDSNFEIIFCYLDVVQCPIILDSVGSFLHILFYSVNGFFGDKRILSGSFWRKSLHAIFHGSNFP